MHQKWACKKRKITGSQSTHSKQKIFLIFDWYIHTSNYTHICLWGWLDFDLLSNTDIFDSHTGKHCIKDINPNYIFQLLPKMVIKKLQRYWEMITVFWILHIITCWKREKSFFLKILRHLIIPECLRDKEKTWGKKNANGWHYFS